MAGERFNREEGKPRLAEAPPADLAVDTEVEASELLTRLEHQAAESGRLEGQTQTLERALKAERDGSAAARGHAEARAQSRQGTPHRAEHDRAARAAAEEDLERVRQGFAALRAAAPGLLGAAHAGRAGAGPEDAPAVAQAPPPAAGRLAGVRIIWVQVKKAAFLPSF